MRSTVVGEQNATASVNSVGCHTALELRETLAGLTVEPQHPGPPRIGRLGSPVTTVRPVVTEPQAASLNPAVLRRVHKRFMRVGGSDYG